MSDLSLALMPSAKYGAHVVWFSGRMETPKGRERDACDAKGTQRRGGRRGRRAVIPENTSGMSFALIIASLSKQLGKPHPLVSSHRSLLRCGGLLRKMKLCFASCSFMSAS